MVQSALDRKPFFIFNLKGFFNVGGLGPTPIFTQRTARLVTRRRIADPMKRVHSKLATSIEMASIGLNALEMGEQCSCQKKITEFASGSTRVRQ